MSKSKKEKAETKIPVLPLGNRPILSSVEALEFLELQKELLMHKYLYYVKAKPSISDYDYDMLEDKSRKLAKKLGFRSDQWEGPTNEEKNHIHWMVGYDDKHPLVECIISRIEKLK